MRVLCYQLLRHSTSSDFCSCLCDVWVVPCIFQALQVARDQWSQDEAYAACFQRWSDTVARAAKKSGGAAAAAAANPIPAPSATRPELLGRSANEHLLKCIYSIRSSEAAEVLLALPVDYALQV